MNLVIEDVVKSHVTKKLNSSIELANMWGHIAATNPSARKPYHNNRHMHRMAGIAGFLFENTDTYAGYTTSQRHVDSTLLFIACLWHDYGHSAGLVSDAENIQFATQSFKMWWADNCADMVQYIYQPSAMFKEKSVEILANQAEREIVRLMWVTEFPFVHDPKTPMEFCIRDADLLYTFDEDTGKIVHGLYMELKSSGKFPPGFSFMNFMDRQYAFLNSCTHYTGLGRQIHNDMKDDVLARQFAWAESQGFA